LDVLVTGADGMVGRKLVKWMVQEGRIGLQAIDKITLVDVVPPFIPKTSIPIDAHNIDLAEPGVARALITDCTQLIVHLAAMVSGEAEGDFEAGYRVNLDGTRHLLEAARKVGAGYKPRFIYASSIAALGGPFPKLIPDDFNLTPPTSYGTQKAICELLLADYTRRGFIDGVGLRIPNICIRPGTANNAATSFFSNIIREPLLGMEAILPVAESIGRTHASPRAVVDYIRHASTMDTGAIGPRRNLPMPGIYVTVAEQIAALGKIAGSGAVKLIRREPDSAILDLLSTGAQHYDASRAKGLGFKADKSFDDIISAHIEDELA
jgi:D-erythronate 2-dehydrogenase